jgi:hypothetical protein
MNASALLEELLDAGIRLGHDGEDLIADVLPSVDFTPYTDHVRSAKPALLDELRLREQIIAALDVEPADFDRGHYERLTAAYTAHERSMA